MSIFLKKQWWPWKARVLKTNTSTKTTQLFAAGVVPHHQNRPLFKFAHADEEQGALSAQRHSVQKVHEVASTKATQLFAAGVEFKKGSKGFTLFEVLIALTVFAFSVTGLVMALDSMVKTVLETRQRVFSRLELESRLAYNMVDPPVSGDRTFTNHGITFTESLAPVDMTDTHGNEIRGIYRLKIASEFEKVTDSAEVLIYRP